MGTPPSNEFCSYTVATTATTPPNQTKAQLIAHGAVGHDANKFYSL